MRWSRPLVCSAQRPPRKKSRKRSRRARWGHQLGDTVDQLQRREGDLIHLGAALVVGVAAGLAVLLGATIDPLKLARRMGVHITVHGRQQQRTLGVAGLLK